MLVSPEHDPTTEAELDALFALPKRHRQAAAYVERIRYTPPELRDEFHQRALERWPGVKAARRKAQGAIPPRRSEPSPSADSTVWKRWLRDMREHRSTFKYIGIPLVGQGYQTAHLEGNKALLSFLPLTIKGTVPRGPLRDAFLCAAAALLSVPECYSQVLDQMGQGIPQRRRAQRYDVTRFGDASNLGINEVARFLASTGVSVDEAEQWRPWATAYIDMEVEEHPNGGHAQALRQARDRAHARINNDPTWVLRNVHPDAPGNYNPVLEQSRAARRQLAVSSSSNAEAGPSSVTIGADAHMHSAHSGDTEESDIHLAYEGGHDEDSQMGPA